MRKVRAKNRAGAELLADTTQIPSGYRRGSGGHDDGQGYETGIFYTHFPQPKRVRCKQTVDHDHRQTAQSPYQKRDRQGRAVSKFCQARLCCPDTRMLHQGLGPHAQNYKRKIDNRPQVQQERQAPVHGSQQTAQEQVRQARHVGERRLLAQQILPFHRLRQGTQESCSTGRGTGNGTAYQESAQQQQGVGGNSIAAGTTDYQHQDRTCQRLPAAVPIRHPADQGRCQDNAQGGHDQKQARHHVILSGIGEIGGYGGQGRSNYGT